MTRIRALLVFVAALVVLDACRPHAHGDLRPDESNGSFRISVWNVAESSFIRRPEAFRRILQATDADIFSFDEVGENTTPDQLLTSLQGLRGNADTVWHLSWGSGGDYQRTVIASRTPLEQLPEFSPLPFPKNSDLILQKAPDSLHARLRSDFARGVATNASVIEVRGRRLLLVGLDLWARGSPDSWEETRRRVEAAAIRDGVALVLKRLDAQHRAVSGVVIGGDMNLVAGRAPLDTLLTLVSGRFNSFTLAPAVHEGGWSTWTWDGRGGPFHSARMDVVVFSDLTLRSLSARIINWDDFPASERAALGLTPTPVAGLSRHRPVVVEFAWR